MEENKGLEADLPLTAKADCNCCDKPTPPMTEQQMRSYCLDLAGELCKEDAPAGDIVDMAARFYGFLENGY